MNLPRRVFSCLCLAVLCFSISWGAGAPGHYEIAYSGMVGEKTVGVQLLFEDNRVSGGYGDNNKVMIPLKGSLDEDGNMTLYEYGGTGGAASGIFEGRMLSFLKIQGSWSDLDFTREVPFLLKCKEVHSPKSAKFVWTGSWKRRIDSEAGVLTVASMDAMSFAFTLEVWSGTHAGKISGQALRGQQKAYWTDKENGLILTFLILSDVIAVDVEGDSVSHAGSGVSFEGNYYRQEAVNPQNPVLVQLGVLQNASQEKAFKELAGDYYRLFLDSFQLILDLEDADGFGAAVYSGAARGLFAIREAIVMYDRKGRIWAAAIDGDKVRYFTNDPAYAGRLPKTIEKWRERFGGKEVVFAGKS
ncbi:MAG: hypothetical protein ACM3WV_01875 [Bacillota bacterium]